MTAKVSLRSATEQDFKDVLEVSKGIYDGGDYLPFLYHSWLKSPNKYVFVAELQRKVIGLVIAAVIDGGQTVFCQSLRIHREYRGRGYGYQIMIDVIDHVLKTHPQITKARLTVEKKNKTMEYISKKLGYKPVMIRNCRFKSLQLNNREVDFKRDIVNSSKELCELERKYAVEFVLHQRRFDGLIPDKTLVVTAKEVFEVMSANAGIVFKDDDKMFTDVSVEELKQNVVPRSFSHGRMVIRINGQSWLCNIYANDRHAFKAQMVRQMMAAIEQAESFGRISQFKIFYSSDLDFEVQEIFEEVLGLEQAATIVHDELVLHEKDISKQSLKNGCQSNSCPSNSTCQSNLILKEAFIFLCPSGFSGPNCIEGSLIACERKQVSLTCGRVLRIQLAFYGHTTKAVPDHLQERVPCGIKFKTQEKVKTS